MFSSIKAGSFNFNSNGSNELNDTNSLKSQIVNNLIFSSSNYISNQGIKTNYNVNLKNLNTVGKNVSNYRNSPQIEFTSLLKLIQIFH